MNKPEISKDFTIEDIHKIREYHYEKTKNMSVEEKIKEIRKNALEVETKIKSIRALVH